MQYTESNRGVPDERVQYLARVGQWLVTEWAAAQDHPFDKYRVVYGRILSRLAFQMQKAERSEILATEAEQLIAAWLPEYGFQEGEGAAVLSGIKTKTGILVSDLPQAVVFSQFGLQEYYASVDLLERVEEDELLRLSNEVWWREPLLLAVAQQKEPSPYLDRLFKGNALLAAEAVAECPTPPLTFQEHAIDACIEGIDSNLASARSATVPLLRKIRGAREERLITALESRLSEEKTAKTAGLILAIAGTAAATSALERHPSVWGTCIQEAGYLSNSLENLLVSWIKNGDESQSQHATILLAGKLSADRFQELIDLLPILPVRTADLVASMLLKDVADRPQRGSQEWVPVASHVSSCVAKVNSPHEWARTNMRRSWYHSYYEPIEIVLAAIAIRKAAPRCDAKAIRRILLSSGTWVEGGSQLLLWIASALAVAIPSGGRNSMGAATFVSMLLLFLAVGGDAWISFRPLFPTFLLRRSNISMPVLASLILFGSASLATLLGGVELIGRPRFWRVLALASCCGLLALCLHGRRLAGPPSAFCLASKWFRAARIAAIGWLAITVALVPIYCWAPDLPRGPLRAVAFALSVFFLILTGTLYRDYSRACSAAVRLATELAEGLRAA